MINSAYCAERASDEGGGIRFAIQPYGLPLIGKLAGSEGAYVASGHNVWGILNAPATGEALAELIADGVAVSTDLTPFDPVRLRPLDPSLLRSG